MSSFTTQMARSYIGQWCAVGAGYLAGGGGASLVSQYIATGQPYFWQIKNAKRTNGQDIGDFKNPHWIIKEVGDVNNDGRDDLIFRHQTNADKLVLWLMKEDSTHTDIIQKTSTPSDWVLVSAGAINLK